MISSDQFKVRRRIAIASFIVIILTLIIVLIGVISGSEDVGKNLSMASGTISPIILCLTSIIGQYQYSVFKTDTLGEKNEK